MLLHEPVWVESIDSTNKELKRRIAAGELHTSGYILAAREQYAGRGRFERVWQTVKGENLTFSLVLATAEAFPRIATIPLATGLGVCNYLISKGVVAEGKWPNDVLVQDRKICGILSEQASYAGQEYIIVGVGLNLNMSAQRAGSIAKPATSLKIELGEELDPAVALRELLPYISSSLGLWQEGGFARIRPYWELIAWRLGKEIELDNAGKIVCGRLVGFGDNGQLVIADASENRSEYWSGDVSIKRDGL